EGAAAAAGPGDIRVSELEAGAVDAFDVVNFGSVEVLITQRIDVHLHTVGLEELVHFGRLVFEVEVVLEPSAPAADDAEAEPLILESLCKGDLTDLLSRIGGDRNHGFFLAPA